MNGNPSLSEAPKIACLKCNDTGTINEMEWYDSGILLSNGKPMRMQRIKLDPLTGYPPVCECQKERIFEGCNAALGMSEEERTHTFKSATIDDDNRPHFEIAVDFVKNIDKHRELGTWLYIFGDETRADEFSCSAYGTGKTYLMNCIANALTHRKIPSLYVKEEKMFGDIKATYNRGSEESESEVLERYYRVPIMFIDDLFSSQYNKEWAESKLFSILDARKANKKMTIITSNYAAKRIRDRLPINGAKIASRIIGQAIQIEMIGKDRRFDQAREKAEVRRGWSA